MIPVAVAVALAAVPPGVDLLFPVPGGPVRVRVEVAGDAPTATARWAGFLLTLFDYFDRDGNGILSIEEAERVIPLPLPGGQKTSSHLVQFDADRDGAVSRSEFLAYYRRAGFTPVTADVRPQPVESARAAAALARHLDRDGDGKLSAAEMADAPRLLRKLDADEDEALTPAEIAAGLPDLAAYTDAAWPTAAPPDAPPSAVLRLGTTAATLTGGGDRFARIGPRWFAIPDGEIGIGPPSSTPSGVRDASEFLAAQLLTASGDGKVLAREAVTGDPTLRALAAVFDPADRDGDGKLTGDELKRFLNLIEQGATCRTVVAVADHGWSLFDRLDTNDDGRLDRAELARAAKAVPRPDAIPRLVIVSVGRGPLGTTFGPVRVAFAAPPPPRAKSPTTGPAWFAAQDRNGDGQVSAAEFVGPPDLFRKLDADGDGVISAAEARAAETGRIPPAGSQ